MTAAAIFDALREAGFTFRADPENRLVVAPANRLNDEQRSLVRQHKAALLQLLDVETLLHALTTAGPAGLDWREGTPADWSDDRLLDAGEVLYRTSRMVNRLGRRYLALQAPQSATSAPASAISSAVERIPTDLSALPASDRTDPLHREDPNNPQAARIAELIQAGWSPWNAKARARSEAMPGWQHPQRAGDPGETLGCE